MAGLFSYFSERLQQQDKALAMGKSSSSSPLLEPFPAASPCQSWVRLHCKVSLGSDSGLSPNPFSIYTQISQTNGPGNPGRMEGSGLSQARTLSSSSITLQCKCSPSGLRSWESAKSIRQSSGPTFFVLSPKNHQLTPGKQKQPHSF